MLIIRGTALRWHEHVLGFCVKHGNLQTNENRKGTSHRKTRPKVEKWTVGAESFVVVMKSLKW